MLLCKSRYNASITETIANISSNVGEGVLKLESGSFAVMYGSRRRTDNKMSVKNPKSEAFPKILNNNRLIGAVISNTKIIGAVMNGSGSTNMFWHKLKL